MGHAALIIMIILMRGQDFYLWVFPWVRWEFWSNITFWAGENSSNLVGSDSWVAIFLIGSLYKEILSAAKEFWRRLEVNDSSLPAPGRLQENLGNIQLPEMKMVLEFMKSSQLKAQKRYVILIGKIVCFVESLKSLATPPLAVLFVPQHPNNLTEKHTSLWTSWRRDTENLPPSREVKKIQGPSCVFYL